MFLLTAVGGLLGGTGAAAAGTGAAASTGLSLSSILSGVATVGGIVASIAAGNAESENLKAQARDAEAEKGFEIVQSVDRKRSLLKAAQETVGEIDVAYAGSGVDLSFGSAAQARTETFREADLGLTTDSATTEMRLNRLTERAANYRAMAKRAKRLGLITGLSKGFDSFAAMAGTY